MMYLPILLYICVLEILIFTEKLLHINQKKKKKKLT